ncbi:hypothetical protein EDB81DRAFT_884816 [Dactylonectria macrodidyma]|uniref:Uncharacterized protein n=1 Tax=Dactylonectria macrodidyma TaxID=307937 RepID=A0A9P9EQT1_9HYPO|nr:hypothetical protein EDB81DRAFT_884816 [Dactylonectria macrodidyma]
MTDRKSVSYTFERPEDFEHSNQPAIDIVVDDTGAKHWMSNRAMPPTSYPPPLTPDAIEKLKNMKGVIVREVSQQD